MFSKIKPTIPITSSTRVMKIKFFDYWENFSRAKQFCLGEHFTSECDLSFLNVRIRDSRKTEAPRVKKNIYNSAIIYACKM